ncbi:MAG TPA: DUF5069 domain-containing protein [Candidatus Baltobacteraceae bacterium]|nr:DUF5069 domain-containing protein [Candidatus Baltobacteraceae bacterium]
MATDFRDGKTFPRRGRDAIDGVLWLKRVSDKGRAAAAGTIFDYIYPCPMDKGVMERWGITPEQFDAALTKYKTDEELLAWLRGRVPPQNVKRANEWLLAERIENLDRQDAEEGVTVG